MDKKILIFGLLSLVLTLVPLGANAQDNFYQLEDGSYIHYSGLVPCGKQVWLSDSLENQNYSAVHMPCQFCHLFVMLSAIISFLLTSLVPILAVILLVAGGIMYYLSLGNPEKLSKANKMLQGTIIGLVIIYGAWMIVGLLLTVIGVADWTGLEDGWYTIDCPIRADFATLDDVIVLEVAKEGPGKVISTSPGTRGNIIDCGLGSHNCASFVDENTTVVLEAEPRDKDSGITWEWSGACSGTGDICSVSMDESKLVIIKFDEPTPTPIHILSIQIDLSNAPGAKGAVELDKEDEKGNDKCEHEYSASDPVKWCEFEYKEYTEVKLTANSLNADFLIWESYTCGGRCAGKQPTCDLSMYTDSCEIAVFVEKQP